ncbi:GNAT family N-acetyltransferase [Taklimakanibacter albus]|uniref:GNAT family N-acetyltransferase n=1 Tax=Taklimakanibacter albus TaxID=2800327 RepID=A0ACC5RF03_9HYPH|nr:GNAT family N-acetyltransferase [Aestuariivirga sp. YIM B02566]MBK1871030.1 GNAT family N-acetyltransferase [Aestuariivirga sp. YIM B02566]
MMPPAWREVAIAKAHDRAAFDCGEPVLNDFLKRYARQSHEQGSARTFVAIDPTADTSKGLGFYSLAPATIAYERAPKTIQRGLARHEVPGFRLARLAVDRSQQGRGLGAQLFGAAARRCIRAASEVGGLILIIDAKSERAAAWYMTLGAQRSTDEALTLIFPLARVAAELQGRSEY